LIALLEKQFVYIMFPMMTLTAALNLSLIANQESRENQAKALVESKQSPQTEPKSKPKSELSLVDFGNGRQATKEMRKTVLVTLLKNNPHLVAKKASESIGVSDQTIYNYLDELESDGLIEKTDEGILVR
jgi:GTP-sensing pleiotropic transcriptional regulator CodY